MTRRLFFAGIAAVTLISTGCCGTHYGCGGHGLCGWYPGKILGRAFACHGYGHGRWGGGWCHGGCGVGCDSCDGSGNWMGPADGQLEPSPQVLPSPAYYPQAVGSPAKAPAPPKGASTNWGYRGRGLRPVSYTPPPGPSLDQPPNICPNGRCACGRH
ncbi:MAG: hypothetical protein GTO04_03425 [Planctomycetales bacterium]|nr:hypothetical protein [Planctomycetales bacterium]